MSQSQKITFLLFILLLFPLSLFAFKETGVGNNLLARVEPDNPGPGETVTITLTSYDFDIKTSTVSWYINDVLKSKELGRSSFTLNLKGAGEQTRVMAFVQSGGGQKATKTFIFDPSMVELFWEALSSKPPFYQGKALPGAGSDIRVFSAPYVVNRSGQKISSDKLVFNWEKNGVLDSKLSGQGKSSALFNTAPKDTQLKIRVNILNTENNVSLSKNLVINLIKPEVLFYEKKPLEGINYGQTLPGEYSLFDSEVTVRAEPYFAPMKDNLSFNYSWMIDRSPATSRPDDPLSITLRQGGGTSGSNRISFFAQNQDLSFDKSFIIKYGQGILPKQ